MYQDERLTLAIRKIEELEEDNYAMWNRVNELEERLETVERAGAIEEETCLY